MLPSAPAAATPALHAPRRSLATPRRAVRRCVLPAHGGGEPRTPWRLPAAPCAPLPAARAPPRARAGHAAAAGGPGAVPGGSDDSTFASSEVVRREAQAIFTDFGELSRLQPKYFSFDLEGKRIFISKIEQFLESLKVFTLRYELSDDPFARECMRQLNAKLLEAGLSRRGLMEQLESMVAAMRVELDREEMRGVSPAPPGSPQHRMPDMAKLMLDPDISEAMEDPHVLAIVQKCAANPALVATYAPQPKVYALLKALFGDPGQPPGR